MKYYIYHIPGIKIGCTRDFKIRNYNNMRQYSIESVLLETIEGPNTPEFWQIVGDREWELADQYEYTRGTHYKSMCERSQHPRTQAQIERASKFYKLTKEIADQIREEYSTTKTSHRKLAIKYNINKYSIGRIVNNQGYLI
jgi:hypothetical protein